MRSFFVCALYFLFLTPACRLLTSEVGLFGGFSQPLNLYRSQIAVGTFREIAEHKIAGLDPLELDHRVADTVEHAPDLALPAFMDRYLKPGVCLFLANLFYPCRRGFTVIKINALFEIGYLAILNHALDLRQVGLWKLMFRVRDQVGEVAVICHEQKALGVIVKPSHGIDAHLDAFQKVLHRGPPFGVGHGRDKTRGLVQHDIGRRLLGVNELAVHLYVVFGCICLAAEFGHHRAVHTHSAFRNKFLSSTTRRDARGGYNFLNTF
jgi:hypothetical protein